MSCDQLHVAKMDSDLSTRETEIAELRECLAALRGISLQDDPPHSVELLRMQPDPARARKGRSPPIDAITGEDPAVHQDDWLPALKRVARWNDCSKDEQVIQLAGHLRAKVLQI